MVLKGHVSDGAIVLDDPTTLPNGVAVYISLSPIDETKLPYRRYRGTSYTYADPFEPAAPASDWEATH